MRRLVWLLAAILVCALPTRTLADSHGLHPDGRFSSACGLRLPDEDAAPSHPLRCTAGVAVRVVWSGMTVRPAHGTPLRVRFTDETEFATDSGEGVLDGLVAGDYVCVSYRPHPGTVTALLVIFSPQPIGCRSGNHPRLLGRQVPCSPSSPRDAPQEHFAEGDSPMVEGPVGAYAQTASRLGKDDRPAAWTPAGSDSKEG